MGVDSPAQTHGTWFLKIDIASPFLITSKKKTPMLDFSLMRTSHVPTGTPRGNGYMAQKCLLAFRRRHCVDMQALIGSLQIQHFEATMKINMKRYEPWYVLGEVSGNASKRYSLLRAAEHTARRELIERELKREAEFEQLDVMVARKTLWRHEMAGYQMVLLMGYRIREQVETRFGLLLLDTRNRPGHLSLARLHPLSSSSLSTAPPRTVLSALGAGHDITRNIEHSSSAPHSMVRK
ncbi:hypothetical protein I7I51_06816 [Histoplasma capsulatum]|uniref:Uncharacterized protein n=1 Tax=Ajellomyces capsulatus TaxID=5037 RepID=A0A8A1MJB0_AJECA|nr:hypothetical protein I7I51_06816 [Histoplasma capsulatum]